MGRPREFDPEEALDRATRLFWELGYEATSVQGLVDALGISRASLYGTFGDKPELFEKVLERYDSKVSEMRRRTLEPPAAGRSAVAAYFSAIIEGATGSGNPKGCLFLHTATGCTTVPEPVLAQVRASIRASPEQIHSALARDPSLARRSDLAAVARFLATQATGITTLAGLGVGHRELDEAAEVALRVLDQTPAAKLAGSSGRSRSPEASEKAHRPRRRAVGQPRTSKK